MGMAKSLHGIILLKAEKKSICNGYIIIRNEVYMMYIYVFNFFNLHESSYSKQKYSLTACMCTRAYCL